MWDRSSAVDAQDPGFLLYLPLLILSPLLILIPMAAIALADLFWSTART